jgi:Tol biopolymer transport system component
MQARLISRWLIPLLLLTATAGCDNPDVLRKRFRVLGGTIRQVTMGGGGHPDWSVLSDRIAYVYRGQVWSIKPDGEEELQLTDHPGEASFPRWRPGGGELAFAYDDPDGETSLWLLTGGVPSVILRELRPITALCWSRDGDRLYFVQESSPEGIEYTDTDGSNRGMVVNPLNWGKVLSVRAFHNSDDLLYVEFRGGVYNLFRIPESGGEPVRLTDYNAEDPVGSIMSHAAPSRDGTRLAVLSSQEHLYQDIMLHAMPAVGGDMVQLIELSAGIPAHPVWSPDDSEIALQLTTIMTEVWVLELK